MLWGEEMGCGRSKNQSPQNGGQINPDIAVSTPDKTVNKKKKMKGEKKENKDPQKKVEKSSGNLLSPPSLALNGALQQQTQNEESKTSKTVFKDAKAHSGTHPNIKVTHSQIEFFKMLDEKIEQGDDYSSQDGLEIQTP